VVYAEILTRTELPTPRTCSGIQGQAKDLGRNQGQGQGSDRLTEMKVTSFHWN